MKKILIFLSLIFGSLINAQNNPEFASISISPSSELLISGSTNVNKFHYFYHTDLFAKQRKVCYQVVNETIFINNLDIDLKITGFDCGNKRMNEDFCDLLNSEEYPQIKISLRKIECISEDFAKAFISVRLAGKSNNYILPVKTSSDNYQGKLKLNIRDFGLEPPKKALGLIEVDELIEISFDLDVSI